MLKRLLKISSLQRLQKLQRLRKLQKLHFIFEVKLDFEKASKNFKRLQILVKSSAITSNHMIQFHFDYILAQLTEELTQLEQVCIKSSANVKQFARCKNLLHQRRSATNPMAKSIIINGDVDDEHNCNDNTIKDLELETVRSIFSKQI